MRLPEWTQEELRILRGNYADASPRELAAMLPGRSHAAIKNQAKKLGLRKSAAGMAKARESTSRTRKGKPNIPWSPEEQQILLLHYGSKPISEIRRMLPGRSAGAIHLMAMSMGLKRSEHARKASSLEGALRAQHPDDPDPVASWNAAVDATLDMHASGALPAEAGDRFGISSTAYYGRLASARGTDDGRADHVRTRGGQFPFSAYGLKPGDRLSLMHHPEAEAVILADGLLECEGSPCSPSAFVHRYYGPGTPKTMDRLTFRGAPLRRMEKGVAEPVIRPDNDWKGSGNPRWKAIDMDELFRLRGQGLAKKDICARLGITPSTYDARLRKARESGDPRAGGAPGYRAKPFPFDRYGLKPGDRISLAGHPDAEALVAADGMVRYEGKVIPAGAFVRTRFPNGKARCASRITFRGVPLEALPDT